MRTLILLLTLFTLGSVAIAQSKKDKIEIGVRRWRSGGGLYLSTMDGAL